MSLSLAIVIIFLMLGLGLIVFVSSPKIKLRKSVLVSESIAPLIFLTPLLSWLIFVKYNNTQGSFFVNVPMAATGVMVIAVLLVTINLKK